jgi:hypothetical protein
LQIESHFLVRKKIFVPPNIKQQLRLSQQGCQMVRFQTKNPNLGKFWRALGMKKVGIFYGHLELITSIWYMLCPFSNLVANGYISRFWYFKCRKIWQPCVAVAEKSSGVFPFLRGRNSVMNRNGSD